MRHALWTVAAILVGLAPGGVQADSWAPFGNFRQVEAAGRFYMVVKKAKGAPQDPGRSTPVTFEIAERKAGSVPVTEVRDQVEFDRVNSNADVRVRDGDTVLGRGKLDRCPLYLLISSTGLGVGLDVRGYNYRARGRAWRKSHPLATVEVPLQQLSLLSRA